MIIPAFKQLARKIGPGKIIWRYDPIFISAKYTLSYHIEKFASLAKTLSPYTKKCIVSFLDLYAKIATKMQKLNIKKVSNEEIFTLMRYYAVISKEYGLVLETCAELWDFATLGIVHGSCIDKELLTQICGKELNLIKDKTQRPLCGCMASVDIGSYNSCANGCLYCYANGNFKNTLNNIKLHNPKSSALLGTISPNVIIKERKVKK